MDVERSSQVAPEEPNTTLNIRKEETSEGLKHLFAHCFEITELRVGDRLPVGGRTFFSSKVDIEIECDFENFQTFLSEVHGLAGQYDLAELRKWLDSVNMDKVDEKLFAVLFAFTKKLEDRYPMNPSGSQIQGRPYIEKAGIPKLSDIFNANIAACAEIAALAKFCLQQENIPSTYFSGDALWDRSDEFSEAHSFIVIRQGGTVYIYDPANPTNTDKGKFPSLFKTEADFDEEMSKGQKKFVSARNLLTGQEAFYGVSNGTNVDFKKHII